MHNNYYNSSEFKTLLEKYEASEKTGKSCYFDADDFMDIAEYYILDDRPENALKVLETGERMHPSNDDLRCTHASAYIYVHRFEEARKMLDMIDKSCHNSNIVYQKAQLAYAIDNDIDTAEQLFTDWLGKEEKSARYDDPAEHDYRIRDAYIHIITSFIELSEERYDEELVKRWIEEYYARFAPLGENECDYVLADVVRDEGMMDMVEKIYSSLLEHDPYINHGLTVLSSAQIINGNYSEAVESADFALAINPDDIDALLNKARALYGLGNLDKALPLFDKYFENHDDISSYIPYAACLISHNRVEEARNYLDDAEEFIQQHKDIKDFYAQMNYELGESYMIASMPENALKCATRAVEQFPENSEYNLLEGTLHLLLNNKDECINSFNKSIINAKDRIATIADVALRFIINNEPNVALHLLDLITEDYSVFPSYRIISAHKALAYLKAEMIPEFMDSLKKACSECPDVLRAIFNEYFPDAVDPKDYYSYVVVNNFTKDI